MDLCSYTLKQTFANAQVHFVEMDPWVVSNVLQPNLQWTGFLDVSVIHTVTVEKFLERAQQFVGVQNSYLYAAILLSTHASVYHLACL